LNGSGAPCPKLPARESAELTVLLELYSRNVAENPEYDPWNPIRLALKDIQEVAPEAEISDLIDKGIIYKNNEISGIETEVFEMCYPKHFAELSKPENETTRLTIYEVECCRRFGGSKDKTNLWALLEKMWWSGPNELRVVREISLAQEKPKDFGGTWIGDVKKWAELEGEWKVRQDTGADKIKVEGANIKIIQLKLTKDPIGDKVSGGSHRDSIEKVFNAAQRQINGLLDALVREGWVIDEPSFSFCLHAPKLTKEAQKAINKPFTVTWNNRSFEVLTEWVHGNDLLACFPTVVQRHLKGKLG